jgi:hypothetical protein
MGTQPQFQTAQQWRIRAAQARSLVPSLAKEEARARMLELAKEYDGIADRLDRALETA